MTDYTPFPPDYPLREELIRYSEAVLDGQIIACQKHKWACQRFLRDLEREGTDTFPYCFDERAALRFLSWMRLFKHRKGGTDRPADRPAHHPAVHIRQHLWLAAYGDGL